MLTMDGFALGAGLDSTQQNIGIHQNAHLASGIIKIIAAYRRIAKRRLDWQPDNPCPPFIGTPLGR